MTSFWPFRAKGCSRSKRRAPHKLLGEVCARKFSLKDAQDAFRKDWTLSYQVHMKMKTLNAPEQE